MSDGGGARPRTVFFGSPAFAVPSLERVVAATDIAAIVTQPDRPAGRGQAVAEPAVKQAAHRLAPGVPVLQPEKIRTGVFGEELRRLGADLFVVVAYGRILPQSILDLPRLGPWNVHASVLPRLRGAAPIQWAVINADTEAGVSIMRMEAGLDTGPVAAVATTPIADADTAGTLSARLSALGADLFAATLPRIVTGAITPVPQDDARATLAPPLRKEDGRLDFTRPARLVSARARGVDPWPGATALLDEQPVRLFGARATAAVAGTLEDHAAAGTVVAIDASGLRVACGEGTITFAEIQLPGRKRLAAAAAAAGRAIAVGVRLG
ncbi:MAG: methionyl-tRNA formyltransferase [Pseudomonadota bacterium]